MESDQLMSLKEEIYSRHVREKFRQYTVDYVKNLNNLNELKQIIAWYTPSSQPRNIVEKIYVDTIRDVAYTRYMKLKNSERDLDDDTE